MTSLGNLIDFSGLWKWFILCLPSQPRSGCEVILDAGGSRAAQLEVTAASRRLI
jgi:hypothetical protein